MKTKSKIKTKSLPKNWGKISAKTTKKVEAWGRKFEKLAQISPALIPNCDLDKYADSPEDSGFRKHDVVFKDYGYKWGNTTERKLLFWGCRGREVGVKLRGNCFFGVAGVGRWGLSDGRA